jgi:hypothetical protein
VSTFYYAATKLKAAGALDGARFRVLADLLQAPRLDLCEPGGVLPATEKQLRPPTRTAHDQSSTARVG